MSLDRKTKFRNSVLSAMRRTGDIIVEFEDDSRDKTPLGNKIPTMHYAGIVTKLPEYDSDQHRHLYRDGTICELGDVVLCNGCHFVLAKTKIGFQPEWKTLDTSEFEFNALSSLEQRTAFLENKTEQIEDDVQDLSGKLSDIYTLSSLSSLSGYVKAPQTSGEIGQVLTISTDNQTEWTYLSSITKGNSGIQLGQTPSVGVGSTVVGPTLEDVVPPDQTTSTLCAQSQYLVGISENQVSVSNPQVYKSTLQISDVKSSVSTTYGIKNALLSALSGLQNSNTVGQVRNSLTSLYEIVNRLSV